MSSTVQAQGRDPNQFAEQRIYLRKKVARPLPIELLPGKGVWLHDLGEGGLSVSGSSPLQLGTNTYLSFQFPEANSVIEAAGVVAWSDLSGRVGVRFTRVKPDSTAALKRWLKAESAMKDISAITGESGADEPLASRIHSLDLVSELQSQVADTRNREAALDLVAQRMLQLTRASGAAIALREGADVVCRASAGNAPPVGMKLTLDSTLSGECFRTGNLVLLGDSDNDSRVDPEVCRDLNFRSLLIHPIISDDQVSGILEVLSPLPGNFEGGDVLVLGFVAEMVASLDPPAVSPSSPAALGELSQFICEQIPEEADPDLLNLSSNLADPVEEAVVEADVLDEPFFALDRVPTSNGSAPLPAEFESLPAWRHQPPQPAIAEVAPYVERAIQQQEIDVEPLEPAAIEEPPTGPLVERAAARVAPMTSPTAVDTLSRPSFTAHESVARTPFRAHEPIAAPKSRVPLYVTAGVAVALLGIGGSYYGLRSRSTQTPVPTAAPAPTATASAPTPAPTPANDLSRTPTTAPVSSASVTRKGVKAVRPAAAGPAAKQPPADEEVSVTLSRDAASNSLKASESGDVPAAPSLNGISDGGGAINSVTALAGAPTTRVEAGARPALSASAPAAATGVTGGQLLRRVSPIYPDFARRSGITGSVVLSGTVTTDGVVKHIKVISGNAMLADAAIRAVNQWRYSPFIYNGKPVETETRIVLNFNH